MRYLIAVEVFVCKSQPPLPLFGSRGDGLQPQQAPWEAATPERNSWRRYTSYCRSVGFVTQPVFLQQTVASVWVADEEAAAGFVEVSKKSWKAITPPSLITQFTLEEHVCACEGGI